MNQGETDRRRYRKACIEMGMPYFEKARKQYYEKGFGLVPSGKDEGREVPVRELR